MEYSGAVGKLIHEKNQKQKISWHCPFKVANTLMPANQIRKTKKCIHEELFLLKG